MVITGNSADGTVDVASQKKEKKKKTEGERGEKKIFQFLSLKLCILWYCNPFYEQFCNSINHYLSQIN